VDYNLIFSEDWRSSLGQSFAPKNGFFPNGEVLPSPNYLWENMVIAATNIFQTHLPGFGFLEHLASKKLDNSLKPGGSTLSGLKFFPYFLSLALSASFVQITGGPPKTSPH
jgi:hypothetical protein